MEKPQDSGGWLSKKRRFLAVAQEEGTQLTLMCTFHKKTAGKTWPHFSVIGIFHLSLLQVIILKDTETGTQKAAVAMTASLQPRELEQPKKVRNQRRKMDSHSPCAPQHVNGYKRTLTVDLPNFFWCSLLVLSSNPLHSGFWKWSSRKLAFWFQGQLGLSFRILLSLTTEQYAFLAVILQA